MPSLTQYSKLTSVSKVHIMLVGEGAEALNDHVLRHGHKLH